MRALVVGAGPAGCTASVALARQGADVLLVEIEPAPRPLGVGLLLQNSPLRALDSLGLVEQCVAWGYVHDEIDVCDRSGRVLTHIAPPPLVAGHPGMVAMSRAALADVLLAAVAAEGVELRLSTTVEQLDDQEEQVRATLSDGAVEDVDLVVVADGSHSRTRDLLVPDAPSPRRAGQAVWRAAARRPPGVDRYSMLEGGPELGKVGVVPISEDHLYVWLLENEGHGRDRPAAADRLVRLREMLDPFGGDVPVVAASLQEPVDVRSLHSLLLPLPWSRGRCVIIGDAAHTTTPQIAYGVGMAIEDSVVLAQCLAAEGDVPAALLRYGARRFDRCALVVESSVQLAAWEQSPPADPALPGRLIGGTLAALADPY